mmetsp:Transcript_113436/g.315886  ORF Transcript_113436/g.315886 Transcript_113436/m.315886 type:complete len:231 (-) Transcript_113436:68-760(-)
MVLEQLSLAHREVDDTRAYALLQVVHQQSPQAIDQRSVGLDDQRPILLARLIGHRAVTRLDDHRRLPLLQGRRPLALLADVGGLLVAVRALLVRASRRRPSAGRWHAGLAPGRTFARPCLGFGGALFAAGRAGDHVQLLVRRGGRGHRDGTHSSQPVNQAHATGRQDRGRNGEGNGGSEQGSGCREPTGPPLPGLREHASSAQLIGRGTPSATCRATPLAPVPRTHTHPL